MKLDLDDRLAHAKLAAQAVKLSEKQIRKAEARGLNRAMRGARTELVREVRKDVQMRAGDIREHVATHKASAKDSKPTARLAVKEKPVPLVKFGTPRQVKKGVKVTVKRKRRQLIQGAFIVEGLGGNAFLRHGDKRLPIRKLFGPSVRQLAPQAFERARPRINERILKEVQRSVDLEIERAFKDR